MLMNYKYVIAGADNDFYDIAFEDVRNKDKNITYLRTAMDFSNPMIRFLRNLHFSGRANMIFNLPGKFIWNRFTFENPYKNTDKICFVVFGANYARYVELGVFESLRKRYSGCKIVCYFQDLASKCGYSYPEKLKDHFDLILSFDQKDCDMYGWVYYPLVYSEVHIEDNNYIPESDVYFVGKAKDRLPEIISFFKKCDAAGLKCDFHIVGVPKENQVLKNKISYCGQMPYEENLQRIRKTRCMLEIMQQGGHGYTLRYCEAIALGKKLATNNPEIEKAPFYNKKFISVFKNVEEFDPQFILNGNRDVDYNYLPELSPLKLLEFIDDRI